MPREGTRSSTGNSKPRVFQTVDTAPAFKRTTKPVSEKKTETEATVKPVKPVKPAGVTKKKRAPKPSTVEKVKTAVQAKAKKVTPKSKTAAAK
ncbi:hypothetical protein F4808DRAFT_107379 [Astrocystis sublimbata]|nr:hypothetical protein F4808DRAFT_107379 [Astrocystis sublimbata]